MADVEESPTLAARNSGSNGNADVDTLLLPPTAAGKAKAKKAPAKPHSSKSTGGKPSAKKPAATAKDGASKRTLPALATLLPLNSVASVLSEEDAAREAGLEPDAEVPSPRAQAARTLTDAERTAYAVLLPTVWYNDRNYPVLAVALRSSATARSPLEQQQLLLATIADTAVTSTVAHDLAPQQFAAMLVNMRVKLAAHPTQVHPRVGHLLWRLKCTFPNLEWTAAAPADLSNSFAAKEHIAATLITMPRVPMHVANDLDDLAVTWNASLACQSSHYEKWKERGAQWTTEGGVAPWHPLSQQDKRAGDVASRVALAEAMARVSRAGQLAAMRSVELGKELVKAAHNAPRVDAPLVVPASPPREKSPSPKRGGGGGGKRKASAGQAAARPRKRPSSSKGGAGRFVDDEAEEVDANDVEDGTDGEADFDDFIASDDDVVDGDGTADRKAREKRKRETREKRAQKSGALSDDDDEEEEDGEEVDGEEEDGNDDDDGDEEEESDSDDSSNSLDDEAGAKMVDGVADNAEYDDEDDDVGQSQSKRKAATAPVSKPVAKSKRKAVIDDDEDEVSGGGVKGKNESKKTQAGTLPMQAFFAQQQMTGASSSGRAPPKMGSAQHPLHGAADKKQAMDKTADTEAPKAKPTPTAAAPKAKVTPAAPPPSAEEYAAMVKENKQLREQVRELQDSLSSVGSYAHVPLDTSRALAENAGKALKELMPLLSSLQTMITAANAQITNVTDTAGTLTTQLLAQAEAALAMSPES